MSQNIPTYDLIVGLGRSGISMARFLCSLGRTVKATDIDPKKAEDAQALKALGVETLVGSHDQAMFDNAARIIPSPGIPLTIPFIRNAMAKGVPVTGELDIFAAHNKAPVIAVTGTNGKTTTTTLVGDLLKSCGFSCFVGGNIGTPLVDALTQNLRVDWVVAEVSSFQLDLAKTFCPEIGLLLNITEDHLDRYASFKEYQSSKWSLFARQVPGHVAIVNRQIPGIELEAQQLASQLQTFSSKEEASAQILGHGIRITTDRVTGLIPSQILTRLPGIHNLENGAAAILAALAAGGDLESICQGLANFTMLPHRMAFVREVDGILFYNDSKATNIDAVIRALESFNNDIILILGGREKDTDFTPLIRAAHPRVKQILAIGEATAHILSTFETFCQVVPCKSMSHAVAAGREAAGPGDVVLLSPACASFDMYANYQERGNDFQACVMALTPGGEAAHG